VTILCNTGTQSNNSLVSYRTNTRVYYRRFTLHVIKTLNLHTKVSNSLEPSNTSLMQHQLVYHPVHMHFRPENIYAPDDTLTLSPTDAAIRPSVCLSVTYCHCH